jgi:segregation and condensation protein B
MEISNLIPHIEALIFASDKPLTPAEITELINLAFGFMEDKVVPEQVDAALNGIVEKYQSEFYPFEVRMSGGGWQFLTKKDYHKTVAQLNGEKFLKRLSAAALETLAIVAYKQPVTKGEIEAIRGVSSDYAVQKLLEKELIVITGRNEKLPGHPLVYATSKNFMDYFGINSPEDLPKIKEVLSDQVVIPTAVHHTDFEQSESLAVSDDGQLIDADREPGPGEETPELNGHAFELIEDTGTGGTEDEGLEQSDDNEQSIESDEEEQEENSGDEEGEEGAEKNAEGDEEGKA